MDIDVDRWAGAASWDLSFSRKAPVPWRAKPGTLITVRRLNDNIGSQLRLEVFVAKLHRRLASAYALFLKQGLRIKVNGSEIKGELPEIADYAKLGPARHSFNVDGVDVLIVLGVTPPTDRTPRGWYVFCNGRMVVDADKGALTGWGTPVWNPKFNHFCGLVYFRSADLLKLPWTTTKEGVEFESPVFQKALGEMRIAARPVLNFLNSMYPNMQDVPEAENVPARTILQNARSVPVTTVARQADRSFKAKVPRATTVSIQYSRPIAELEKIRDRLDKPKLSATQAGQHTWGYFLGKECP